MRVALERQDVRRDPVQEPAIVRDHHHAAGELQQRVFQRAQRFHVEVVRRLIQQQHVAAGDQRLGHVQAAAFTARQRADLLLLVAALEVEAADIGARRGFVTANRQHVGAARDLFEHRLGAVQRIAALVDERHLHGRPDLDLAAVRLFLAREHLEERRLAGAVRADDADDGARRHLEAQVFDQHAVAETLADVIELDHFITQALTHRDEDFLGFVALLVVLAVQLVKAGQARLGLGLAALRVLAHPLQFLVQRLLARRFAGLFLLQARFLLVEPRAVVALPGDALAAVQLQDPFGGVIEEVAVVGHGHHGAREARQELLQPVHRLRIQVVGRFVEQQHVGARQQQAAQRHAALFTAGEMFDLRVPRRQAQRVGGDLQLQLGVVAVARGQDGFVLGLIGGQRVEVGVRLGIGRIDLVELLARLEHAAQGLFHRLAHGLLGVELRLLRQVADVQVRHRRGLALDLLVEAGHDLEQRGLARAVQAQHADLGAGEERQRDVLQDVTLGRNDLAHAVHGENVLCHGCVLVLVREWRECIRHAAARSRPQPALAPAGTMPGSTFR
ncbi:hypothetical protein D9M72_258780 [compost metagenome]